MVTDIEREVLKMKYCQQCGNVLDDNAAFCGKCGAKIEEKNFSDEVYIPDETFADMFLKREGRLNRLRYFKRSLVYGFAVCILNAILIDIFDDELLAIINIATLYVAYTLDVRRLQDLNRDSTFAWIVIVGNVLANIVGMGVNEYSSDADAIGGGILLCIIGILILPLQLYMLFAEGTHGVNRYGADPLEGRR